MPDVVLGYTSGGQKQGKGGKATGGKQKTPQVSGGYLSRTRQGSGLLF